MSIVGAVSQHIQMDALGMDQTHNLISPNEARATPQLMQSTMTRVRFVGTSRPMSTDIPSTATDTNALSLQGVTLE